MSKQDVEFKCPECNHESTIIKDTMEIYDVNGKKLVFRDSCPRCCWVKPLEDKDFQLIVGGKNVD